jgi:hypothetical protein
MRMEDCRTARQVAEWNPQGKSRRGRPVSTWEDGIRDSMQRRDLKDENVTMENSGEREGERDKNCLV